MREFKLSKAQKVKLNNRKHNRERIAKINRYRDRILHLEYCQEEAIKSIKAGDAKGALISFEYNMNAKLVTSTHPALFLLPTLKLEGELNTPTQIAEFIKGFH